MDAFKAKQCVGRERAARADVENTRAEARKATAYALDRDGALVASEAQCRELAEQLAESFTERVG